MFFIISLPPQIGSRFWVLGYRLKTHHLSPITYHLLFPLTILDTEFSKKIAFFKKITSFIYDFMRIMLWSWVLGAGFPDLKPDTYHP